MRCARPFFLILNSFMALVGFAALIFGGVGAGLGGKLGNAVFPVTWFYVLIVIGAAIFVISILGVVSVHKNSRYGTCCFWLLTFVLLVGVAVAMTTLILYANSSAGALEGTVLSIQQDLASSMIKSAQSSPKDWKTTQDALDCCGVDVKSLYYKFDSGHSRDELLTGAKCTAAAVSRVNTILATYPTYTTDAQTAVDTDAVIGGGFFCIPHMLQTGQKYTVTASVVSGVVVLIEFISIVLVFDLFCRVREQEGGFAVLDENAFVSSKPGTGNDIPEANSGTGGGVFLKPGGNAGANGIVGSAQQFAGRMSMRMGFTPHNSPPSNFGAISPSGPPMGAPSGFGGGGGFGSGGGGGGGGFGGLPEPNAGGGGGFRPPPPPAGFGLSAVKDFGSRMSMNLKQAFNRGPPPGPPPGFGGGGAGGPPMPNLGGPPMPNLGGPPMPNIGAPPAKSAPSFGGLPPPNSGGGLPPPNSGFGGGASKPPPPMSKPAAPAAKPPPPSMASSSDSGGGGGGGSNSAVKNDPKYKKYITMEKCKLPEGAIRQKMTLDGLSEAEQDAFFR